MKTTALSISALALAPAVLADNGIKPGSPSCNPKKTYKLTKTGSYPVTVTSTPTVVVRPTKVTTMTVYATSVKTITNKKKATSYTTSTTTKTNFIPTTTTSSITSFDNANAVTITPDPTTKMVPTHAGFTPAASALVSAGVVVQKRAATGKTCQVLTPSIAGTVTGTNTQTVTKGKTVTSTTTTTSTVKSTTTAFVGGTTVLTTVTTTTVDKPTIIVKKFTTTITPTITTATPIVTQFAACMDLNLLGYMFPTTSTDSSPSTTADGSAPTDDGSSTTSADVPTDGAATTTTPADGSAPTDAPTDASTDGTATTTADDAVITTTSTPDADGGAPTDASSDGSSQVTSTHLSEDSSQATSTSSADGSAATGSVDDGSGGDDSGKGKGSDNSGKGSGSDDSGKGNASEDDVKASFAVAAKFNSRLRARRAALLKMLKLRRDATGHVGINSVSSDLNIVDSAALFEDFAYDAAGCCTFCQLTANCAGSWFIGSSGVCKLALANACPNGQSSALAGYFYYDDANMINAGEGDVVSNGNCGTWTAGGVRAGTD